MADELEDIVHLLLMGFWWLVSWWMVLKKKENGEEKEATEKKISKNIKIVKKVHFYFKYISSLDSN